MELDNLKEIWLEENKKLEARIAVNETLIMKMNLDKTIGQVDRLVMTSILGRNLAFVYCIISVVLAGKAMEDLAYSIPAFLGGMAMLWSFISHLPIKRPAYALVSVVELQKLICKFRIHTAANAIYDISIMSLWLLTLVPLSIKLYLKVPIYSNITYTLGFFAVAFIVTLVNIALSRKIYSEYNQKLKAAEAQLETIGEFEKV